MADRVVRYCPMSLLTLRERYRRKEQDEQAAQDHQPTFIIRVHVVDQAVTSQGGKRHR